MLSLVSYTNEEGNVDLTATIQPKKTTLLFTRRYAEPREINDHIRCANLAMTSTNALTVDPDGISDIYYRNKCTVRIRSDCFFRIFNPLKPLTIATLIVEFNMGLGIMEIELCFHSSHLIPKKCFYPPEELDQENLTVMDGLNFFQWDWIEE